jgi:hypothetical protein
LLRIRRTGKKQFVLVATAGRQKASVFEAQGLLLNRLMKFRAKALTERLELNVRDKPKGIGMSSGT